MFIEVGSRQDSSQCPGRGIWQEKVVNVQAEQAKRAVDAQADLKAGKTVVSVQREVEEGSRQDRDQCTGRSQGKRQARE